LRHYGVTAGCTQTAHNQIYGIDTQNVIAL